MPVDPSVVVNFSTVLSVLQPLAYAAVIAAIGVLVPTGLKRLGIANNADLTNKLTTVLDAGAGEAYRVALSHEGGLANVAVYNGAIAAGINYVLTAVPTLLTTLGVTPATVEAAVKARLGALLANDPTVSAGTPPVTPAMSPLPAAGLPPGNTLAAYTAPLAAPIPVAIVGEKAT
jgi:hypothetical protein